MEVFPDFMMTKTHGTLECILMYGKELFCYKKIEYKKCFVSD